MATKKAAQAEPTFNYQTWRNLSTASLAPSLWRDDRAWIYGNDREHFVVYCGWRWAYGLVFVLRMPPAGHVEAFFSKIRKPKKGELPTDIPEDWVPERIGEQWDYYVANSSARNWGKQLKAALQEAGDLRIPNVPKKYL